MSVYVSFTFNIVWAHILFTFKWTIHWYTYRMEFNKIWCSVLLPALRQGQGIVGCTPIPTYPLYGKSLYRPGVYGLSSPGIPIREHKANTMSFISFCLVQMVWWEDKFYVEFPPHVTWESLGNFAMLQQLPVGKHIICHNMWRVGCKFVTLTIQYNS